MPQSAKLLMLALAEGHDLPAAAHRCGMRTIHARWLALALQDQLLIDEECRVVIPSMPQRPEPVRVPYEKVPMPPGLRREVFARDGFTCQYCFRNRETLLAMGERLTCDHVLAEWKGGATTLDNLVTACQSCNSSKGTADEPRPKVRERNRGGTLVP